MNKTLKNILYFFIAVLIAKFFGTFRTFFIAKILQPSDYGIWITIILINSYSPILSLGAAETLLKNVPYYLGRNEKEKAIKTEAGVLGIITLTAIIILVLGFSFHLFIRIDSVEIPIPIVRIMCIASALSCFSSYFYHRFAAYQNFQFVSTIDISRSFMTFVLLISLSYYFGLQGTVFGLLITEIIIVISTFFLSNKFCGKLTINFQINHFWNIIKIGFPISIVWWIFILQSSADRVISMSLLGKTATGYYGLGVSIISVLILLPMAIGRVLYPRVNEKIGETTNKQDLYNLVFEPTHALSILLPLMIGSVLLISPFIYNNLLPNYRYGLVSAQILLIGSFFTCLVRTGVNFLIAIDKQSYLLGYFLFSLAANIFGNITLVKLGMNIEGIAISTSFAGILLTTLIWKSVFKNFGYNIIYQFKGISKLYLPFFLFLILIGLCRVIRKNILNESGIISIFYVLAFVILYLIVIYTIPPFNTRANTIFQLLRSKLRKVEK